MPRRKPDSSRSSRRLIFPRRPARETGPLWKAMQGGELRWAEGEIERMERAATDEIVAEYEADQTPWGYLRFLRKLGFQVTQPSVPAGEGEPVRSWMDRADESPFRKVQGLILTVITVEPTLIFMSTKKGAGPAVGAAIDGADWWDVLLGTSASPDTVLLITENRSLQDQVMHRLQFFHDRYGAAGEIERRPFHE